MIRAFSRALAALLLAAPLMAAAVSPVPSVLPAPPATSVSPASEQVNRGRYLAAISNCIACHTAPGGAPLAGGLPLHTPLGTVVSTNITPDKETGIGAYSRDDFEKALRRGVAKHGKNLYPAMPYPSYARLADNDVDALYAYLFTEVKPVSQSHPEPDVPWLFGMRWPIKIWNWLFLDSEPYRADASRSAEWNRGAYLTQAVAHCGACHTPRNMFSAEKALDARNSLYLAGTRVDGWSAPNLTGDQLTGLGGWSREDIGEYLRTGRNVHATSFGPMSEVISGGSQHMVPADALAIGTYLKSLPGVRGETEPFRYDPAVAHALAQGRQDTPGARRYAEYCMACHGVDGKGFKRVFPPLAGNAVVADPDPASLIKLLLDGAVTANVATGPAEYHMPAYGWTFNDQELANILTFIRGSWGNRASPVTESAVARQRTVPANAVGHE